MNKFTDAKAHYERIQSDIKSYTDRLKYFDEDQEAADAEKPRACEPRMLYELDSAGIPQISQEAVDIINAIGAGIIDPSTYNPSVALPSNIETKPSDLMKLFAIRESPPGFEDIKLPNQQPEEEYYNEEGDYGDETTTGGPP